MKEFLLLTLIALKAILQALAGSTQRGEMVAFSNTELDTMTEVRDLLDQPISSLRPGSGLNPAPAAQPGKEIDDANAANVSQLSAQVEELEGKVKNRDAQISELHAQWELRVSEVRAMQEQFEAARNR